jgi:hypothetical protein
MNLPKSYFSLNLGMTQIPAGNMRALNPKEGSDMRTCRIILSLALSIGCGTAVQTPASSEEYRGTLEQQMACTPDVFRLCGEQIPDVNRIVACLRQNTSQLSGSCRSVFESNASVPPQAAPKHRDDQTRSYDGQ